MPYQPAKSGGCSGTHHGNAPSLAHCACMVPRTCKHSLSKLLHCRQKKQCKRPLSVTQLTAPRHTGSPTAHGMTALASQAAAEYSGGLHKTVAAAVAQTTPPCVLRLIQTLFPPLSHHLAQSWPSPLPHPALTAASICPTPCLTTHSSPQLLLLPPLLLSRSTSTPGPVRTTSWRHC